MEVTYSFIRQFSLLVVSKLLSSVHDGYQL